MTKRIVAPATVFAIVASQWAQRQGLPAGNLWEPALSRYMMTEFERLGSDANALAFVQAMTAHRLGLEGEGV